MSSRSTSTTGRSPSVRVLVACLILLPALALLVARPSRAEPATVLPSSSSEPVSMVKDINAVGLMSYACGRQFVAVGSYVYFAAFDGDGQQSGVGCELWK